MTDQAQTPPEEGGPWDGEERRKSASGRDWYGLYRMVENLAEAQRTQADSLVRMETFLLGAFPGDDPDGHRKYHEAVIAREERRAKVQQAIIEKSLAGLIWSALSAIGLAVWHYATTHFKP